MILKVKLSKKRHLFASISFSRPKSHQWIVLIPESGADFETPIRSDFESFLGKKLSRRFNFMVINKPGVHLEGIQPHLFESSFRRKTRIQDNLKALKQVIPPEDTIFLIGYSEGAYLAPQVTIKDPRVKAMVMIGGGTRGWLEEELSNCGIRERKWLKEQIQDILDHPRSLKKWNGFSYATWASYQGDDTFNTLKKIKNVPTLAILGTRDRTIDFNTTLKDLKTLARSRPIQIRTFKKCGHSFVNHWADAWFEIKKFIELWKDETR